MIIFVRLISTSAYAADPSYGFTNTVGGSSSDFGYSVATDSDGNVYVTGSFAGTVDFDPSGGADNHTTIGSSDVFVTKYSSSGAYLWTNTVGGSSGDYGNGVSVDAAGNVYVTGLFAGTVDFDPSGGTDNHTAVGSYDVFTTKYDTAGGYEWTNTVGGTSIDYGYGVSLDFDGNVYVTGYYNGTVDFDPSGGTDNHTAVGSADLFTTKYDTAGGYEWTNTVGGSSGDYGRGVSVDAAGNVYVTGHFGGTVDFDPSGGTDNHTAVGSDEIFTTKYDTAGGYEWTNTVGGSSSDKAFGVSLDFDGNVYVTGYYYGTVDFDPSGGTDNHTAVGSADLFITKYDPGGGYEWTNTVGGTSSENGMGIDVDGDGNVYATGYFYSTVDFDPSGETDNHSSAGAEDVFTTSYSADGSYNWTYTVGSSCFIPETEKGYGIAVGQDTDTYTNIYVTGVYCGTFDFDPTDGTDSHSPYAEGNDDIFTTQYRLDLTAPGIVLDGVSPDPGSDTTPIITGTATEAIGTVTGVEFQMDGTGGSWIACTADDGVFDEAVEDFTCTVGGELSVGDHTAYVRSTDSNGNTTDSGSEAEDTFTIDLESEVTVVTLGGKSVSDGDTVETDDPTPEFCGIAEPGSTVTIDIGDGMVVGVVVVDENGNWCWSSGKELEASTYPVKITVTDLALNIIEIDLTLVLGLADTGVGMLIPACLGGVLLYVGGKRKGQKQQESFERCTC